MIESRPEGRVRYLNLTDRGMKTAKALQDLIEILQKPDEQQKKLSRLKQMISSGTSGGSALRFGPLRRDLAKLKNQGDGELCKAAERLDSQILGLLLHHNR